MQVADKGQLRNVTKQKLYHSCAEGSTDMRLLYYKKYILTKRTCTACISACV